MFSQEALEKILGIQHRVDVDVGQMLKNLTLTYYPYDSEKISKEVLSFNKQFEAVILELGIKIIPYKDALERVSLSRAAKRFFKIILNNFIFLILELLRKEHGYYKIHYGALLNLAKINRIKKGITIISLGENRTSNLPIDYVTSFSQNSIVTILDCPPEIDEKSSFTDHFDTAMRAFAYHMTQVAILVDQKKWIVYNFNASHPVYPLKENFKENILKSLIPKVAAPIKPPLLKDFVIKTESFDIDAKEYQPFVGDIKEGAKLFNKTNLYPPGKKVETLPFRSNFYKWIGKIHLDHRSGMSYGFLAYQLPVKLSPVVPYEIFVKENPDIKPEVDFCYIEQHLHLIFEFQRKRYVIKVPDVQVLTQRSGSDKTNVDPHKDLLLLGLRDGALQLQTPIGSKLRKDYRPSFDTKVILAHAVGNAIIASILKFTQDKNTCGDFSERISHSGAAIAHWHGYINSKYVPPGWVVYGGENPHVACSTSQSAIYALGGKLNAFFNAIKSQREYRGDVHIEPHHGTNITFTSLIDLAKFLLSKPDVSTLGNMYLEVK